ncbi:hypothetical protein ACT453_56345, partial [Bacillus sp. D-CC]
EKGWGVEYIGSQNGIEKLLVQNVKYNIVSTGKLRRYWDLENFKDPFSINLGINTILIITCPAVPPPVKRIFLFIIYIHLYE